MYPLLDRNFNRCWIGSMHHYLDNTETRSIEDASFRGYVKCRLVLAEDFSFMIPDLIFLETTPLTWIQPLHFFPHFFIKDHARIACRIWIDISCGQTVSVMFSNHDFLFEYADGAELYKCIISGPPSIKQFITGVGAWSSDQKPMIQLFHHTAPENLRAIKESHTFKPSRWNIQGTASLERTSCVYLTCLPRLDCPECLCAVAMSSKGYIELRRDACPPSARKSRSGEHNEADDVLRLSVYRENTRDRTESIDFILDPGLLAPNHLVRHFDGEKQIWYEVISAFTYRIAVPPTKSLAFDPDNTTIDLDSVLHPNSVIIGDAWTIEGLAAPFSEENTACGALIQRSGDCRTLLDSWYAREEFRRFEQPGFDPFGIRGTPD